VPVSGRRTSEENQKKTYRRRDNDGKLARRCFAAAVGEIDWRRSIGVYRSATIARVRLTGGK